jgi:hypothetical protein
MRLESPHIQAKLHPTIEQVRAAFRHLARAGLRNDPFLILDDVSDFCQGFVQAIRQSDGWWVEFKPSDGGRHYRLPEAISQSRAASVFEDFLKRGSGVADLYPWVDVTEAVAAEGWGTTPPRSPKPGDRGDKKG